MDNYKTLNVLLDALFDNNCLQNWSVFEEISGSTVVKLRFTKSMNSESEVSHHQSFRRKSDSQIQRDRNRAVRHRADRTGVTTRRQASAGMEAVVNESPEQSRDPETIYDSEPGPLEVSPMQLDPAAPMFDPESLIHNSDIEDSDSQDLDQITERGNVCAEALSELSDVNITMPTMENETFLEMPSQSKRKTAKHKHTAFRDILCVKCVTSIRIATHVDKIKMLRCQKCKVNICENCYEQSKHFYECKERVKVLDYRPKQ